MTSKTVMVCLIVLCLTLSAENNIDFARIVIKSETKSNALI